MNQSELLDTINTYNSTEKKVVKTNLKRIMKEKKFKLRDIEKLGFKHDNAASWTNKAALNAPLFDQALTIGVKFKFDVMELTKAV